MHSRKAEDVISPPHRRRAALLEWRTGVHRERKCQSQCPRPRGLCLLLAADLHEHDGALHPLDQLQFVDVHSPAGLRSRGRQRALEAAEVDRWTNRVIAVLHSFGRAPLWMRC